LELQAAGSDKSKIADIREKYSNYYLAMMYNLDAYDNAAKQGVASVYATDTELKAQAMNGLEKVMRCTAQPVYDQMAALQDYWKKHYGEDFFTDKQLNDSEMSLNNFDITGIGKFNDYNRSKDYSDNSDVYVEKLKTYQEALTLAISEATSQEEIDAAFAQYYESAYGWALDEAEAHGVILDKRGAQTTAEKNSWAEFIRRAEENQQAALSEGQSGDQTTVGTTPAESTGGSTGEQADSSGSTAEPASDDASNTEPQSNDIYSNTQDLPADTPETVREYVSNGRRNAAESEQSQDRYDQAVSDLGIQDMTDGNTTEPQTDVENSVPAENTAY